MRLTQDSAIFGRRPCQVTQFGRPFKASNHRIERPWRLGYVEQVYGNAVFETTSGKCAQTSSRASFLEMLCQHFCTLVYFIFWKFSFLEIFIFGKSHFWKISFWENYILAKFSFWEIFIFGKFQLCIFVWLSGSETYAPHPPSKNMGHPISEPPKNLRGGGGVEVTIGALLNSSLGVREGQKKLQQSSNKLSSPRLASFCKFNFLLSCLLR